MKRLQNPQHPPNFWLPLEPDDLAAARGLIEPVDKGVQELSIAAMTIRVGHGDDLAKRQARRLRTHGLRERRC